jgi:hypothetical protein
LAMPDLDLIKQAKQGVRDGRGRFLRVKMASENDAHSGADGQPGRNRSGAQQIRRDQQCFAGRLAVLAQPGGDIHRVAEIRDLPLRNAALANDEGTGMNAGAEPRHDVEFLGMGRSEDRSFYLRW